MGTVFVVIAQPPIRDGAHLLQRREQVGIKDLSAVRTVESFNKGILIGLARLNVSNVDSSVAGPVGKRLAAHLGAVVTPDGIWSSVAVNQPLQDSDQSGRRNGCAHLDGQAFAVGFIDDIQRAKRPAAVQRIVDKVRRPAPIDLMGQIQRLRCPILEPLARSIRNVQSHIAIHPVNVLVIPAVAIEPQSVVALPKAPAPVLLYYAVQGIDDSGIPLQCRLWPDVVRRPRQACDATSACDRELCCDQLLGHLAPGQRRQDFRFNTSLIAAFSSARSAYMRFRRAFSASSSRNLRSSEGSTPAYFVFHW